MKTIRVDAGTIGKSEAFKNTAAGRGAFVLACAAERQRRQPEERQVHPLMRQVQALIASTTTLPPSSWAVTLAYVCYMKSCMSNTRSQAYGDGLTSPMEHFYKIRPDFSKFKTYGTPVTWPLTGYRRSLKLKNGIGVWVGLALDGAFTDIVLEKGKRTVSLRAGVQVLNVDLPTLTTTEIETLLSETATPLPSGEIGIMATAKKTMTLLNSSHMRLPITRIGYNCL
jgi:hypothetical protein